MAVTERAAKFLAAQLARHPAAVAVRLAVRPSGCSGFGYHIDPTDSIREGDRVFDSGGLRIAVDALSLSYLQGATGRMAAEGLRQGLKLCSVEAGRIGLLLERDGGHTSCHARISGAGSGEADDPGTAERLEFLDDVYKLYRCGSCATPPEPFRSQ